MLLYLSHNALRTILSAPVFIGSPLQGGGGQGDLSPLGSGKIGCAPLDEPFFEDLEQNRASAPPPWQKSHNKHWTLYHHLATILSVQAGSECRIRPGRDRWHRNATLLDSKSTIGHTVRYFLPWVKCDLEDFWNKSDTVESIPLYGWSVSIGFYREN